MTLPEGTVALEIPKGLSAKSYAALKSWVDLMVSLRSQTKSIGTSRLKMKSRLSRSNEKGRQLGGVTIE
jgi:hypothetical protein